MESIPYTEQYIAFRVRLENEEFEFKFRESPKDAIIKFRSLEDKAKDMTFKGLREALQLFTDKYALDLE